MTNGPFHASPFTSPDHHHAGRYAAAHVERQKTFDALNLMVAGGLGELAIAFHHLANASRANRMAIPHEPAPWVDRQGERRKSSIDRRAPAGQRRGSGLQQLGAATARGEAEDFI